MTALFLTLCNAYARVGSNRKLQTITSGERIEQQYIVELEWDARLDWVIDMLAKVFGVEIVDRYDTLFKGFVVKGVDGRILRVLLDMDDVKIVSEDGVVKATAEQNNAPWGLDSIDQSPGDKKYTYSYTGKGVDIFILDTGINKGHKDFGGRVRGCGKSSLSDYSTLECLLSGLTW